MSGRRYGYVLRMSAPGLPRRQRWALGAFVFRFPLVHLGIGIAGNALFLVGTVLFITGNPDIGVWFFLAGSIGMLVGSVGEGLRALGKRRLVRFDVDPKHPDEPWSATDRRSSPL
jgi:hypothetical protein